MKYNKKSAIIYTLLVMFIVTLFILSNINNNEMYINIFGEKIKLNSEDILNENNECYLSYDFIKSNIDGEIYYDNISKKIVIASDKCLLKAKIDEKVVSNNFKEENIENIGVIEREKEYISLEILRKAYNFQIIKQDNVIYAFYDEQFLCVAKSNSVEVHESSDFKSKIVCNVDKLDNITGLMQNGEFILVKTECGKIGYISKKLLEYEVSKMENRKETEEFSKYIFADNSNTSISKDLGVDGVFINMFDITKKSGEVNDRKIENDFLKSIRSSGYKLYGIVTNGYDLSGFSTSTLSQSLADENKRIVIMNNLLQSAEKQDIDGLVIDFRMIKEKDKNNFIQFIKEFNALYNKELIVNIDANEYKNYIGAIRYSDFSIINFYGLRNINSTVAGPVSEIMWMNEIIINTLHVADASKIVACIPSYSILWTEKNSKIINAQIYNLDAIEDYISKNKLTKKYIESLQQNYVELKKGSLTYRMWVEDETSINGKLELIKNNNLRGVAIYKLGYENNKIYNLINVE